MANHGIKITKEGKDTTSGVSLDYIFSSKFPSLSVKERGSIELSTTGGQNPPIPANTTYAHNFGYKPQFMVFTEPYLSSQFDAWGIENYTNLNLEVEVNDIGQNIVEQLRAYVTEDNLVITANLYSAISGSTTSIANTYTFDYILFMEEAS